MKLTFPDKNLNRVAELLPAIVRTLRKPVRRAALRRALLNAIAASTSIPSLPPPSEPPVSFAQKKPLKILVAEDDLLNQGGFSTMLRQLGYKADMVCTGAEAVGAVMQESYDVVLMDVNMHEMDGDGGGGPLPRCGALASSGCPG